ncbi:MAG: TRAP transporter substrate-binding protein DctP [Deltaproteobacteria bacterium]|nr:TRAP transporter substrate-binding protein DctP [Deltaproteobacteria bacterium]
MTFFRKAFLAVAAAAVFAAVSPLAAEAAVKWTWKTGTLAPKDIGYAKQVQSVLMPAVEKVTNGEVVLKVYWGGVMGDDEQHLKKMKVDQLQAAGLSGQGTFMMSKSLAILGLPFLFNDYDEVDAIKHQMMARFDGIVAKEGLRLLVWLDQDFDQIYSSKLPVTKVSDFPKTRFITWFGPLEGKFFERMGTSPVPMGITEIPSSLRAGVAESLIAPSIWVVGTQLYSTFRFVNTTRLRYVPAFCVCTSRAWDALPQQYQKGVFDGREKWAKDFCVKTRVDAEKSLNAMVAYGVRKVRSSPEEIKAIKEKSMPLWDELAGKLYPKDLLDELKGHLAQYRAGKKK